MKRLMMVGLIVLCAIFVGSVMASAQALKIGVYDVQKVLKDSKTIEGYRQQLTKNLDEKRGPLAQKEGQVKALDERLKKESATLTSADRTALAEKLANEAKDLKRMREDVELELQRMNRELTQKAQEDIADAIKKIGAGEKFSLILEKNAAGIVYVQESLDITAKILGQMK